MQTEKEYKFLRFVGFENFDKWYVSYYINPHSIKSQFGLANIKEFIKPVKELIKKDDYNGDLRIVEKISFKDGKIHIREENKTGMNLYKLYKNDLLVSKINFHQGAVAINDIEDLVCSTHYQPYKVDYNLIDKRFLILSLRSEPFLNFIEYLRADGIKNEATFEFIGNLQLPLPPLPTQKELVAKYTAKTTLAKEKEALATELEKSIEEYLTAELGIEIQQKQVRASEYKFLRFAPFESLGRWGVEFLLSNTSKILHSTKYEMKTLGEMVDINPRTELKAQNLEISFLPMECVSDIYGEVIEYKSGNANQSKGYTRFQDGDLLWAKITPCMQNGKSAIVRNLTNGFGYGSTEFYVIRNHNSNINLEYIYHILRMQIIRISATYHFTGTAGQQRVPVAFLENLQLPLPPLSIQNRIATHITNLKEQIKALRLEVKTLQSEAKQEFETAVFG